MSQRKSYPVLVAVGLIEIYRKSLSVILQTVLGKSCRFYPSCSVYAQEAFAKFGLLKGFWCSALRICRCHPFHPGGYDPVN